MARVELMPEAREDIAGLDGSVQRLIFKKLTQLQTCPELQGRPLGGSLTGLRKVSVADRQYRIVFQIKESGDVAIIWVIGSRVDSKCYELAKARLALYAGKADVAGVNHLLDDAFGQAGDGG